MSVGRRKARREALFLLYQQDLMELAPERALERSQQTGQDVDPYTRRLVLGVYAHRADIDQRIQANLREWSVSRLAAIERSILRLAVFELLWVEEVPAAVAIDEAVELAKRFASNEGAALVHGVLASVQAGVTDEDG